MLSVTLFGIFLTPLLFYAIQGVTEWAWPARAKEEDEIPAEAIASH
jgi:hypothetical protein